MTNEQIENEIDNILSSEGVSRKDLTATELSRLRELAINNLKGSVTLDGVWYAIPDHTCNRYHSKKKD